MPENKRRYYFLGRVVMDSFKKRIVCMGLFESDAGHITDLLNRDYEEEQKNDPAGDFYPGE